MYNEDFRFVGYEMINGMITGYKAYKRGELVATVEKRNGKWITGVIVGYKVITIMLDSLESVICELVKLVM